MTLQLSNAKMDTFTPPNTPAFVDGSAMVKSSVSPAPSALLAVGAAMAPSHFNWSNVYDFRQSLVQLHKSRKFRRHPRRKSTADQPEYGASAKPISEIEKPLTSRPMENSPSVRKDSTPSSGMNPMVFSASAFTFYDAQLPSTADESSDYERLPTGKMNVNANFRAKDSRPKFYKINNAARDSRDSRINVERLSDGPVSIEIIAVVEPPAQSFPTRPPLPWDGVGATGVSMSDNPSLGGRASAATTQAAAGLAVFMFSLTAVIFLFLLFYLISRFFRHTISLGHATAGRFDSVTRSSIIDDDFSSGNYASGRKFNLLARHFANEPQSVLYPKRIYELQAEEGCLTGPMGYPIPVGLAALTNPTYLLNSSGYEEQNCWMKTVLLTEDSENNKSEKKKSTASTASLSKPEILKDFAKSCGKSIARKLTGIDNPLSKEKLQRIHQLRNEEHSSA